MLTKTNGNGSITVVSNPDPGPTVLHFALLRVDAGDVVFHSGGLGPMQGWAWVSGGRPLPDEQAALYDLHRAGLVVIGHPAVVGNSVRITGIGWVRLSAMNAAAPVRAA